MALLSLTDSAIDVAISLDGNRRPITTTTIKFTLGLKEAVFPHGGDFYWVYFERHTGCTMLKTQ